MNRETLANGIWNACDIMRRDDGTTGIMQYMEQLSWMLFLKAFEAIEDRYEAQAALGGPPYQRILDGDYRWSVWTKRDWPGDELVDFVDGRLFPHLRSLSGSPERDVIAHIFGEIPGNRMKSPYNLRDVITILDKIDFQSLEDTHVVSAVYEELLLKMGQEGGIAGEFYTPRPIVRFMVKIADPKIGETIYDPFLGSGGFLAESYLHMKGSRELTIEDHETLQRRTFYGQEKKPLPTLLGMMNVILHGITAPNIVRKNTLEENIRNIPEVQRHGVILTNPPFGGKEGRHVQQNFPVQSQATELLALQHVMKRLKRNGRCGIVVPEGVLFRGDAFATVKKELLQNYNLHTIVSLPPGVFANVAASGTGPKTNLLFFDRTTPTREIWYYELLPPPGTKYTKTNTIQDEHMTDALTKWPDRALSKQSWIVPVEDVVERGYDLTARNPNREEEYEHRPPEELVADVLAKEELIAQILDEVQSLLVGNDDTE